PSYTSSFNRRVELTIDNPTFSGTKTNATVNLATGTFSASMPTTFVQPGTRTIYARAIQGGKVSPVDSVPITVTS
ncbi:MAG TPA: hypothetical protein VM638_05040, partial [Actinomycetota bacterium]|nr:hypothetical protein [Actinomycetota bacterium]